MNNRNGVLTGLVVVIAIVAFFLYRRNNDKRAGIAKMKALRSY